MSRVERHKDEYSREDRQALENARAKRPTDYDASSAGSREVKADAANPVRQSAAGRTARPQGRVSRSESGQRDEFGVLDQTEEEKRQSRRDAKAMRDGKPEFHGGRALGKLINFVGTLLLIAAILACLALSVPRFAGIDQYVVVSGSMEPAIPVGSMVYSAQTEPSTLEAGDIIVFYSNEAGDTPVTHRVVENHISEGEIITKGDANAGNDLSPVIYANVIGKLVLHVPMLGFIASPLGSVPGKVAMGCVIIAAYLLTVAGSRLSRK